MIKRALIIFMLVCLFVPSVTVYADAIMGNDFFYENKQKAQKLERLIFCVDSPDGYVFLKETPSWNGRILTFPSGERPRYKNGTVIHMEHTYVVNDKYWGLPIIGHYIWDVGWIPMEYLRVMYVDEDFNNEHIDEFYTYTGSYNAVLNAKKLVIWKWPGSDREKLIVDTGEFTINTDSARYAYKDKEGREWGYVEIKYSSSYAGWYGGRGVYQNEYAWICLSDPENSGISAFSPAPKPSKWSPDGALEWLPDDGSVEYFTPKYTDYGIYFDNYVKYWNEFSTRIIIIVVLSALIITLFLIKVLRKRKKIRRKNHD